MSLVLEVPPAIQEPYGSNRENGEACHQEEVRPATCLNGKKGQSKDLHPECFLSAFSEKAGGSERFTCTAYQGRAGSSGLWEHLALSTFAFLNGHFVKEPLQ